jgi:hypothetical protein
LGSALLSGLFLGALVAGMGLNALVASPSALLDYYAPGSPGAPVSASAAPGNASATLHWHIPTNSGNGPITAYVITPYLSFVPQPPRTYPATPTTQIITGLSNAKTYFFKIAAINALGFGPQSAGSNSIRVGAPGTPTTVKALPGKNQATVRWVAPTITNGSPLNGYVVTPFLTGVAQTIRVFNSLGTTQVVKGLLNGRSYTFRVAARNANGTGLVSALSPAVLVAGAPAPPTSVRAARVGAGQLRVAFVPGSSNGLTITSFTVTCTSTNGATRAKRAATSPVVVAGLSPNHSYKCNVRAANIRGTGPVSSKSNTVTA